MKELLLSVALCFMVGFFVFSCSKPKNRVEARTVRAACGSCVFKMEGGQGCYWAVELDGKFHVAAGNALPKDHDAHAPDGMCNMERKAMVEGEIVDDQFVASRFEILPAQKVPQGVPKKPQPIASDKH